MGRPKKQQPAEATKPRESAEEAEHPTVYALGIVRLPKGWAAVAMEIQGRQVVSEEIIQEPTSWAVASQSLKIETVKRLLTRNFIRDAK